MLVTILVYSCLFWFLLTFLVRDINLHFFIVKDCVLVFDPFRLDEAYFRSMVRIWTFIKV